jgi:large subunit ribosomal protein L18e
MSLEQINRKSNSELVKTVTELKKASRENDAPLWKSVALRLEGPSRNWPSVNISKLEFNLNKNSKAVVPGKLLGAGNITKKITVSAYSFSQSAKNKVEAAGGKCLSYDEFIKSNPKGTDVVVIG